jgi:excisionase family DNA binding protein
MTLIDTRQLAENLQIPPRTLDQWAYLGKGPAFIRVGRHRRYRQADVEAWLDSQTRGGDAA